MPRSTHDPFFIAEQATYAAMKANRSPNDIEYLRAYFKGSAMPLSDCEIATATYMAWYRSITTSGIRFEEHASKLGVPGCNLDQGLLNDFRAQEDANAASKAANARRMEEERQQKVWAIAGGAGVVAVATIVGFTLVRRRQRALIPTRNDPPGES
jgi:hypothetical protein